MAESVYDGKRARQMMEACDEARANLSKNFEQVAETVRKQAEDSQSKRLEDEYKMAQGFSERMVEFEDGFKAVSQAIENGIEYYKSIGEDGL